jgi:hypothetical protein
MSSTLRRTALLLVVALASSAGVAVAALTGLTTGATAGQGADRADPVDGDVVSIYDVQTVDPEVIDASFAIAGDIGAGAAVGRTGSAGM